MFMLYRIAALAPITFLSLAGASNAQTLFLDDFESGLSGWTATGFWNLESSSDPCGSFPPAWPTGQMGAYFGNDATCNFQCTMTQQACGELTSTTPISIPNALGGVQLRFWSYDSVECPSCLFDMRSAYVSTNMGASWTWVGRSDSFLQWHQTEIALDDYKGESILLRFEFQALDCEQNSSLGWLIDEVRVELDCSTPTIICTTLSHSGGMPAAMGWSGSRSIADNDFHLEASNAIPQEHGLFFYGPGASFNPFGDGIQCVSGGGVGITRLNPPQLTDSTGFTMRQIDFTAPPATAGPGMISPGDVLYFQYWFRDPNSNAAGFNLSDTLSVQFCP